MRLQQLTLDQFRCYASLELDLPAPGLRVTGRNASGKSSILEAIVILSTARSPRTSVDREVVRWSSGADFGVAPYARIGASFARDDGDRHEARIAFELDEARQASVRKRFELDGRSVRAHTLVGALKTVLFSPEDVYLVAGPPSERRRQLDILLSQIDRRYLQALSRYGRVLTQRNGLLKSFARDGVGARDAGAVAQLTFWDEQLIEAGAYVIAARYRTGAMLGARVAERARALIDGSEIAAVYDPRLALPSVDATMPVDQRVQRVAGLFANALSASRTEEFRRGMTVVGPHRDDVRFTIDGRELARFGSRGQQRLGIVAYKLSESDLIAAETGEHPVVLLDDVLSELDDLHRDFLLGVAAESPCQLIVTSTDRRLLDHAALGSLPSMAVEDGDVRPD